MDFDLGFPSHAVNIGAARVGLSESANVYDSLATSALAPVAQAITAASDDYSRLSRRALSAPAKAITGAQTAITALAQRAVNPILEMLIRAEGVAGPIVSRAPIAPQTVPGILPPGHCPPAVAGWNPCSAPRIPPSDPEWPGKEVWLSNQCCGYFVLPDDARSIDLNAMIGCGYYRGDQFVSARDLPKLLACYQGIGFTHQLTCCGPAQPPPPPPPPPPQPPPPTSPPPPPPPPPPPECPPCPVPPPCPEPPPPCADTEPLPRGDIGYAADDGSADPLRNWMVAIGWDGVDLTGGLTVREWIRQRHDADAGVTRPQDYQPTEY